MTRLAREDFYVGVLTLVAQRSTCLRLQVGSIIIRSGRILSTGYNGSPAGMPHCTAESCGPDFPCEKTIHAEANAIAFAAKYGIATEGTAMFCTDSPCLACAKLIVNSGIEAVHFLRAYRDPKPLELLHEAGVNCYEL